MPRRIRVAVVEKIVNLLDYLVCVVLGKSHRDAADSLRSCPSHHVVIIFKPVQQELNDELQLIVLFIFKLVVDFLLLLQLYSCDV